MFRVSSNRFVLLLLCFAVGVKSQICRVAQYGRCSTNGACGCFHMVGASNTGICALRWLTPCSELVSCSSLNNYCHEPGHICVHHPDCQALPVCYPSSMIDVQLCPPITSDVSTTVGPSTTAPLLTTTTRSMSPLTTTATIQQTVTTTLVYSTTQPLPSTVLTTRTTGFSQNYTVTTLGSTTLTSNYSDVNVTFPCDLNSILPNESFGNCTPPRWSRYGKMVAGRGYRGNTSVLLNQPLGIFIDQTTNDLYIADSLNGRIQKYFEGDSIGFTVAGGPENVGGKLYELTTVFVDEETKDIYVQNEDCVQKYSRNNSIEGIIVAGGNGYGSKLNQLKSGHGIFLDRQKNLYISDTSNGRILRLTSSSGHSATVIDSRNNYFTPKGMFIDRCNQLFVTVTYFSSNVTTPNVVYKYDLNQPSASPITLTSNLKGPWDVVADRVGNLIIADAWNHRVQRLNRRTYTMTTIAGSRNGTLGSDFEHFDEPKSVALDSHGNLFVSDSLNHRVLKFELEEGDLEC